MDDYLLGLVDLVCLVLVLVSQLGQHPASISCVVMNLVEYMPFVFSGCVSLGFNLIESRRAELHDTNFSLILRIFTKKLLPGT